MEDYNSYLEALESDKAIRRNSALDRPQPNADQFKGRSSSAGRETLRPPRAPTGERRAEAEQVKTHAESLREKAVSLRAEGKPDLARRYYQQSRLEEAADKKSSHERNLTRMGLNQRQIAQHPDHQRHQAEYDKVAERIQAMDQKQLLSRELDQKRELDVKQDLATRDRARELVDQARPLASDKARDLEKLSLREHAAQAVAREERRTELRREQRQAQTPDARQAGESRLARQEAAWRAEDRAAKPTQQERKLERGQDQIRSGSRLNAVSKEPRQVAGYKAEAHQDRTDYRDAQGKVAIQDRGNRLAVMDKTDTKAMDAALKLADQKFERGFSIRGSDEFKRATAARAVELGMGDKIRNPEMQAFVKARTQERDQARSQSSAPAPATKQLQPWEQAMATNQAAATTLRSEQTQSHGQKRESAQEQR